jgi:hypothetical protein
LPNPMSWTMQAIQQSNENIIKYSEEQGRDGKIALL